MQDAIRRTFEAMADLSAPSGAEGPLRDWLRHELESKGAATEVDAVGNLLAHKGDGGQLLLLGLDEPTFIATGGGPGGKGAGASGTDLKNDALAGRLVRAQRQEALLRIEKDELTFDPLDEAFAVGQSAVFAAERRVVHDALIGPDSGRRACIAAALAAVADLRDMTLVGLSRSAFSPQGGASLLLRARRPQGVALDVLDEDDGNEIGCGPVLLARAKGYAAPPKMRSLRRDGVTVAVRPEFRTLAARLLPAGVEGLAVGLLARYRGGDQERIAYQDANGLADLLREVLAAS
ncbi:MAG: hypothetical protein M0Z66_11715 [Thermaerobacter sp.]|nr:hypothetical protein [Thermaerobacter sp.]